MTRCPGDTNTCSQLNINRSVHRYLKLVFSCFVCQETFWRIPVSLNPERLRMAAKDLEGTGTGDNEEGIDVHVLIRVCNVYIVTI